MPKEPKKRGAPRKHDRDELLALLENYIEKTQIPILSEFAWKHGLHRQKLYEMPELSDAIKRCITKKEAALEAGALRGDINPTMAIFSLKQIGWNDGAKNVTQHEIKITGGLPD